MLSEERIRELLDPPLPTPGSGWNSVTLMSFPMAFGLAVAREATAAERERLMEANTGANRIAGERERQITEEGWSNQHDDQEHYYGELALAGAAYATCANEDLKDTKHAPSFWPWRVEDWKPSDDPVRNLEKAGALIAAEIDRRLRKRAEDEAAAEWRRLHRAADPAP